MEQGRLRTASARGSTWLPTEPVPAPRPPGSLARSPWRLLCARQRQGVLSRLPSAAHLGTARRLNFNLQFQYADVEPSVYNVRFNPRGSDFLTLRANGTATIHDTRTLHIADRVMAHDGGANVSRYLDDNLLLTAGTDTKIKLWDRRRFTTPVTVFHGHENDVKCLEAVDGRRLVSSAYDSSVHIWDLTQQAPMIEPQSTLRLSEISRLVVSPDQKTLIIANNSAFSHFRGILLVISDLNIDTLASDLTGDTRLPMLFSMPFLQWKDALPSMWALRNRVSFTPLALDCFVANSLQFDPTGHLLAARQMGWMTTTHDMDVMSFYRLHAVPVSTFAELGILYALERQVAPTLSWCDAQRHLSVLSNTTSAIVSSGTPFVIKESSFSADGSLFVTPSANGMEIYETQTVMGKGGGNKIAPEADVRMPEAAEDCVLTAQFAPHGQRLAAGTNEGSVCMAWPGHNAYLNAFRN